jgi:hypothetical protein
MDTSRDWTNWKSVNVHCESLVDVKQVDDNCGCVTVIRLLLQYASSLSFQWKLR